MERSRENGEKYREIGGSIIFGFLAWFRKISNIIFLKIYLKFFSVDIVIMSNSREFISFKFGEITTTLRDDGKITKNYDNKTMPPWSQMDRTNYKNKIYQNSEYSNVAFLTGKKGDISVIDFDEVETYDKIISKHPELKKCYTVKTRRGYHLYFNYNEKLRHGSNSFIEEYKGVDIRNDGGIIIAPPTKYKLPDGSYAEYKYIGGDIMDAPDYLISYQKPSKKIIVKKIDKQPEEKTTEEKKTSITYDLDQENKEKIIDLIDVKYLDVFDSWRNIIWALKNEGFDEDFARELSEKSNNYTDEGFENIWDRAPNNICISFGTIRYYARLSNEKEYFELTKNEKTNKYLYGDTSDDMFAKLVMSEISDNFIYQKNMLYVYCNNWWYENDNMKAIYVVKNFLINFFASMLVVCNENIRNILIAEAKAENTTGESGDNDNVAKYKKQATGITSALKACKNLSKLKNIVEMLKVELSERNDNVEFDKLLPNVICFKNIAFDVNTGKEFLIEKQHYITQNTEYDYTKSTPEQLAFMDKIFCDIFPNVEHRKCYLSIMRTAYTGIRPEKFFLANGCGRNGKGVLNELLRASLGDMYSYKGHITTLTQPIKNGANQELANLHNKRLTILNEPNDNEVLQLGNIKTLTGDDVINARALYSSNTKCNLTHTFIFECNKKPSINGRIDDSAINRFVNIYFPTYFTDNEAELNEMAHAKPQNKEFKSETFKLNYRCVLFDYVIANAPVTLYIPEDIKQTTKEYLYENDEFLNWFNDNYMYVDNLNNEANKNVDFVKVKDVYNKFKYSDFYMNMSKKEKRTLNEKNFIHEKIMGNIQLKNYYFERKKINKVDQRNIIIKYITKTPEMQNEDEDE